MLKKKFKEPNSFSSSISNIQKRYFSKSNHQPNHQLQYNSTQPFDHLNFYTQSMTLTGSSTANNNNGSSTARNLSKYPSFYSASESQLNKSPYLNSRSKQRILWKPESHKPVLIFGKIYNYFIYWCNFYLWYLWSCQIDFILLSRENKTHFLTFFFSNLWLIHHDYWKELFQ